jgi:hypothetical protein
MTFKNYIGILGAILVIAGGMCPMLHIPVIGTWNYWDIDIVLASIAYTLAALALLASVINKPGLLRFCGWALLLLLLFTFTAVYFKVNDYFSFIPFKKLAAAASRVIHYRWIGWALMGSGSLLMIFFSANKKHKA